MNGILTQTDGPEGRNGMALDGRNGTTTELYRGGMPREMAHPTGNGMNGTRPAMMNGDAREANRVEATVSYTLPATEESLANTGLIYDTRMMLHSPASGNPHPETPQRISNIFNVLKANGVAQKCRRLAIREVLREEVQLVHSSDLWFKVKATASVSPEELALNEPRYERQSLYVNNSTALCARLSAGGSVEMCLAVASGRINNGFAIVRPPGHHAEPEECMGFCIFNNVAIAAKVAQNTGLVKKVMILDWDVHHGNGTQRVFNEDPNVLYVSIHRYEDGTFYPGSTFGGMTSVGEGPGLGKSVNVPWPEKGMGDADYLHALQRVIMPIAFEFAPDMVIISAGFDAAAGDDIGGCLVSPAGYAHMTQALSSLANGKLVVVLEGGYNVDAIARSALACTRVLLGEAPPMLPSMVATPLAVETVHQVCLVQSQYWKSISPIGIERELESIDPSEMSQHIEHVLSSSASFVDVMNSHRAQLLAEQYDMSELPSPFATDPSEKRYQDHIYATSDIYSANTLVIFAHDLASLKAELEGTTANIVLERAKMLDTSKLVLDWAVGHDFAIIDINLKSHMPIRSNDFRDRSPSDIMRRLIYCIWDNYVDAKPGLNVVLIGQGIGCEAVMSLVNGRVLHPYVRAVVQILNPVVLPRVVNRADLREWYYNTSLVVMPKDHKALVNETTIIGKRYGSLYYSNESRLEKVIFSSFEVLQQFVEQKLAQFRPMNGDGATHSNGHITPPPATALDRSRTDSTRGLPSVDPRLNAGPAPPPPIKTKLSKFRPCIDIHDGQVKQIVGGSLDDNNQTMQTNHVSEKPALYYAAMFRHHQLLGAHVIMLGLGNEEAARSALMAWPGALQVGGGINPTNAAQWLSHGASKVIVTSYLFPGGRFSTEHLNNMLSAIPKERLVIDLSCRKSVGGGWKVAMNRWQTETDTPLNSKTLNFLARYCSEFLIHAADVEGLCRGIDRELVQMLGDWAKEAGDLVIPVTYAGGANSFNDIQVVTALSHGLVDLTYGSALDIYGGDGVRFQDLVRWNSQA